MLLFYTFALVKIFYKYLSYIKYCPCMSTITESVTKVDQLNLIFLTKKTEHYFIF